MLIISDNLNVRYSHVAEAVEKRDGGSIRELAHKATAAGADVIDISIGSVRSGADEVMAWLVDEVQQVSDLPLSLDAHTAEAIIAGAERAKRPPMLNSYSVQSANPDAVTGTLVPYAAGKGYEIILCTIDPSGPPLDPDVRGSKASELVEAAMAAGVSSEAIYIDPVVVHLSGGATAQEHAESVLETMRLLGRVFDPPIKTVAGVEYLSLGAPRELRSPISRVYLAMLSSLGLTAAFVDVTDAEMIRDIRLIKALRNESLYSVSDAELN